MGNTRDTGFLRNIIAYDASGNVGIGGAANASYKLAITAYDGAFSLTGTRGTGTTHTWYTSGVNNQNLIRNNPTGDHCFYNGGNPTLSMTSSNRVGIGTNSPSDVLDVQKNQNAITNFYFRNTNTTDTNSRAYFYLISGGVSFTAKAVNGDHCYLEATNDMFFQTGTLTRAVIKSGGNVGIGVTNPNGLLSLSATSSNTPNIRFQNPITSGLDSAISNFSSAAQTFMTLGFNAYINSTGNLVRFNTGYASSAINFDESTISFATSTSSSNPVTRALINGSGDLIVLNSGSIRTTGGAFVLRSSTTAGLGYYLPYNAWSGTGTDLTPTIATEGGYGLYFCTNGTTSLRMQITGGGTLYYYALANLGTRILNVTNSGAIVDGGASDITLKENISPLTYGLQSVLKLNPKTYNWIDKEERGSATEIGFIAQEMKQVVPELVYTGSESKLGIDYHKITAVLVKGLQEEDDKVENLKAEVEQLKSRIAYLENK